MIKKTYTSIFKEMNGIGTFKQKDFSDKSDVILPYLTHLEAKKIVEKYQAKSEEQIEFKKIKEECLVKHNGNYIVKILSGEQKYTFEIICNDKPFDNRNSKPKVKVVKKEPEKISFDLFASAVEMSSSIKNGFGKVYGTKQCTLKEWQEKYVAWLEQRPKITFNAFLKKSGLTNEPVVSRFLSENVVTDKLK